MKWVPAFPGRRRRSKPKSDPNLGAEVAKIIFVRGVLTRWRLTACPTHSRVLHAEWEVLMIDEVLEELRTATDKTHTALRRELSKLRTGRAHPSMLDSVRVDCYGSLMPISQVATISTPEARLLIVRVWDKSQLKAVEKAISQSPLGLNPQNDGEIIRVPVPMLSEERRKEFCRIARRNGEDTKVAIRKARHDAKDMLDSLKEDKEAGEDEVERANKAVEEIVQKAVKVVDEIVSRKEKDILEV